jgi:hypothetical protein
MTRGPKVSAKKAYQPPKLTVYGDLTQMTLGMLGGTKMDNGTMMIRT